jgi:hypothetical protein
MIENVLNDPHWDIGKLGNTRRGDKKMRNFTVALVGGLVALAGFAGSASASATIDLIWAATGTDTISGAQATSTDIVLNVVLTAGAADSLGASVSIDYSALGAAGSVFAFGSTLFTPPLPWGLATASDTGSEILNINAGAAGPPGLAAGNSYLLGTITFALNGTPGSFNIFPYIDVPTGDDILDGNGDVISGTTAFNSGTAVVPEPGTLSLLGMGLGGLYVVGRRSSRKR